MGTDAASMWLSPAGLSATDCAGARQYSAIAPSANQSFMPNTSCPSSQPPAFSPIPATAPENSCPGIAFLRTSPDTVCVVGYQSSSVGVTAAAKTRISNSPAPGCGSGALARVNAEPDSPNRTTCMASSHAPRAAAGHLPDKLAPAARAAGRPKPQCHPHAESDRR